MVVGFKIGHDGINVWKSPENISRNKNKKRSQERAQPVGVKTGTPTGFWPQQVVTVLDFFFCFYCGKYFLETFSAWQCIIYSMVVEFGRVKVMCSHLLDDAMSSRSNIVRDACNSTLSGRIHVLGMDLPVDVSSRQTLDYLRSMISSSASSSKSMLSSTWPM